MLSPAGMKWLVALDLGAYQIQQPIRHRRDSIAANLESERIRLRQSQAYRLFVEGQKDVITTQDFYQFARVNEYFGERLDRDAIHS